MGAGASSWNHAKIPNGHSNVQSARIHEVQSKLGQRIREADLLDAQRGKNNLFVSSRTRAA